jgi:hypothetical protein
MAEVAICLRFTRENSGKRESNLHAEDQPCEVDFHVKCAGGCSPEPSRTVTSLSRLPFLTYRSGMKVMLLNDTSLSPHVGSLASSAALERLISLADAEITDRIYVTECRDLWQGSEAKSIMAVQQSWIAVALENVDAVILNGEGTLHHNNGLHYLAILAVAQKRGLKTFLVNSIFQEITFFQDVIAHLDQCICREPLSLAEAAKLHSAAEMRPDLIVEAEPFWEREFTIDLRGKTICTDWHPQRTRDVGATMVAFHRAHQGSFFYPMKHGIQTRIWRSAKANFAVAEAVVAARHHAVYLAILAGRPCVMLDSNSHKMIALQRMLGKPLALCEKGRDLESALKKARANLNGFLELQAKLLAFPHVHLFPQLRGGMKGRLENAANLPISTRRTREIQRYQSQARHWLLQTPERLSLERVFDAEMLQRPER